MERWGAIVLGGGGVGSAAAFHLARRGGSVLVLDRFPPGHDRGSSHGDTRIIRQAYFEHPDYVPLLLHAYERWRELERLSDRKLLHQVGLLQAGPPAGEVVPGVLASASRHHLNVEEFTPDAAMRRFPGFHIPQDCAVVFEPQAGYLDVEHCVLAHLQAAVGAGAELRCGVSVHGWRAHTTGVEVTTDRGVFAADRLIITAGAWSGQLLADCALPLQVLRKNVYWFAAAANEPRRDCAFPTYLFELPDGIYYGFPQCNASGVKMGEHTGGERVTDPLNHPRHRDEVDFARVQSFRARCLPTVTDQLVRSSVCYYTMSPDGHFLVDRHPEFPHVAFAAGLSGHGFKFTCVLGEALADLVLDGQSSLPVDFLRLQRLRTAGGQNSAATR